MATDKVHSLVYHPLWSFWVSLERVRRQLYRTTAFQSVRRYRHTDSPPITNPIFIIGTVRSGTTILAKYLGRHPRIMFVGYELTSEWCDFARIEMARSQNHMANCPPYTDSIVTETCRKSVHAGFSEIYGRNGGNKKIRFLNKNPHLWNKLPFLRAIFPDARLVITSRDIRSTVASMKLLWIDLNKRYAKKYYFPENLDYCWSVIPPACPPPTAEGRIFPGGNVGALAEHWLHTYETVESNIDAFHRPIAVKHSEFVADPHATLARIFKNLELPAVGYSLPERLDKSRNDRWQKILTAEEKEDIERFIDQNRARIRRLQWADNTH